MVTRMNEFSKDETHGKRDLEKNQGEGSEGKETRSDELKENGREKIKEPDVEKAKFASLESIRLENKEKREVKEADDNIKSQTLKENRSKETNELTEKEISEKQKAAIKEGFERRGNGDELTNDEKGNLGEMMMDQSYISKGYRPLNKHRVTSLEDKKDGFRTGIDGVYEKANPDGSNSYVIADAKYNTSQLKETNDGKQMSDNWIDKRLDNAVGKEKADEIREAQENNPDSVSHEVYHIKSDEGGKVHTTDVQKVDSDGNEIGDKTIVECFDENGNWMEAQKAYSNSSQGGL